MKKKIIALLIVMSLLNSLSFGIEHQAWQKPTYVYGAELSEEQILSISKLLGIQEGEDLLTSPITKEDLLKYLESETEDRVSSALVTKKEAGTGVQVDILTPANIRLITKEQFANAAITAGVSDVEIKIAAPYVVTGESALSGVYKAFALNGENLKASEIKLAQKELSVTTEIVQEAKEKLGFDEAKLSKTIVDIKNGIIAAIEKQGSITRKEIEGIINESLAKVKLDSVLKQAHIDKLIVYFEQFAKAKDLDFGQIKEQLSALAKDLAPKIKELVEDAKTSGFFDKLAEFFAKLFDAIVNIFR